MDFRRLLLYIALVFVVFTLWTNWQKDKNASTPISTQPANTTTNTPSFTTSSTTATAQSAQQTPMPADRIVTVKTNVLDVKIDTLGGNIIEVDLPAYPASEKTPHVPVTLLTDDPSKLYVAQSGITGTEGPDTTSSQVQYTTTEKNYVLPDNQNEMDVNLTYRSKQGVLFTKTFKFKKDQYDIHVNYNIQNNSSKPWSGNFYAQFQQRKPEMPSGLFHLSTYTGPAISSAEKLYEKINYSKLEKADLDRNIRGGWVALQQRYFLSSWIPNQQETNHYYSSVDPNQIYTLGFIGPTFTIPAKNQHTTSATIYAGPEIEGFLKPLAPGLNLTIDYGWLWWISIIIFWVMQHIYKIVGNWGWAIVIVTLLIKILFFKLSEYSYRSMAKMRMLQPKLEELKKRYGDDRAKLSQATMELYRKEKVNPLGGCLPIVVQIPVFIALYYVLIESVQLRHAPFILWIHDLSAKDPYYILPILMGISMYFQQRLNPAPPDPIQARMMQLLPLVFTIFFMAFPSGLVLYWLTNNCLTILQQWHVTRKVEQKIEEKLWHRKKQDR